MVGRCTCDYNRLVRNSTSYYSGLMVVDSGGRVWWLTWRGDEEEVTREVSYQKAGSGRSTRYRPEMAQEE